MNRRVFDNLSQGFIQIFNARLVQLFDFFLRLPFSGQKRKIQPLHLIAVKLNGNSCLFGKKRFRIIDLFHNLIHRLIDAWIADSFFQKRQCQFSNGLKKRIFLQNQAAEQSVQYLALFTTVC